MEERQNRMKENLTAAAISLILTAIAALPVVYAAFLVGGLQR